MCFCFRSSPAKAKTPITPQKSTRKVTRTSQLLAEQTPPSSNVARSDDQKSNQFMQDVSYGYNTLLYVFQYLKVQELLRASCVCSMWRDIASHPILWRSVRTDSAIVGFAWLISLVTGADEEFADTWLWGTDGRVAEARHRPSGLEENADSQQRWRHLGTVLQGNQ